MKLLRVTFTAVACLLLAQAAVARDCGQSCEETPECCAGCGETAACQPTKCQIVCGVKKIKKHCWVVECEEFCTPLPGCRKRGCNSGCGSECGAVEDCDQGCDATCSPKCLVPPKCGPVRCRKKLVKKEYTIEVPIYKCVVQNLCGGCCDPSGCKIEEGGGEVEESPQPAPENSQQTLDLPPAPPVVTATSYLKKR